MRRALGTAQFGLDYGIANSEGKVLPTSARNIISFAKNNKIAVIDTARSYGDSEECLGSVGMEGLNVITKLPPLPSSCADTGAWVANQVADSLKMLQITQLYGVLLHRPLDLLSESGSQLYKHLQSLKGNGLARKIGVSIYTPDELSLLSKRYQFDIVQSPFNVIDRRLSTSGWLKRLSDTGVEIHTRSAFLQGLLLIAPNRIPEQFKPWRLLWQEWHNWLADQNTSAVQACLGFVDSFKEIEQVIVGVQSCQQLYEIIQSPEWKPSTDWPNIGCDDERLINPSLWGSR